MSDKGHSTQTFEFKAEMKQLLHLIVHSLYKHPEVFLRELISNSSDALNKVRFRKLVDTQILDPDSELKITLDVDPKKHTFAIEDNGIGMTHEDLVANIGTVARSGTLEFMKTLQEKNTSLDARLIGQFGVGFYSVFMVADEVTIETRHADMDSKGYRWQSKGEGSFTIEEIEKPARGTRISFTLKEDAQEFAEEHRLKDIVERYSNFADFPIYLKDEKINKVTALWHKKSEDLKPDELNEFYKFISNDYEDPLGWLHVSIEGAVSFKALLFIPRTAPYDLQRFHNERSLHLYSNKILIQHDCKDALPEYLRFARGVVDTLDLPLNVSREFAQSSAVMAKIKDILTSKLLAFLGSWAEGEKEKYLTFYRNFGPLLKMGITMDFTHRDAIIELLRFETSLKPKGEFISLKEYVSGMQKDQKALYYISGEHREALERNPNLEYFNKNKIEVLFLTEPVDIFIVPSIPEYDKKPVRSIEKADIDLKFEDKLEKPDDTVSKSLITLFRETLRDKVEDVLPSKRLVDSPVTLVAGKDALEPQMEKMMKAMQKDFQAAKKIMEVNMSHPLVRNLGRLYIADTKNPLLRKCIMQLYDGALLMESTLPVSADFFKRMTEIMEDATK